MSVSEPDDEGEDDESAAQDRLEAGIRASFEAEFGPEYLAALARRTSVDPIELIWMAFASGWQAHARLEGTPVERDRQHTGNSRA